MSDVQRQHFAASHTVDVGQADHAIEDADFRNTRALQYSSPWPWIFASTVSLAIWTLLGLAIWILPR
jgi:hypothetical protein